MTEKNPLASRLSARTILQVKADDLFWKVRVMSPSEAADMGAALSMLAPPKGPQEGAPSKDLDMAQVPRMMKLLQDITCRCVLKASQDGVKWYPMTLVSQVSQQDPENSRVFVGVLTPTGLTTLATKAGQAYLEARRQVGPFPSGPGTPDPDGQESEEVGG